MEKKTKKKHPRPWPPTTPTTHQDTLPTRTLCCFKDCPHSEIKSAQIHQIHTLFPLRLFNLRTFRQQWRRWIWGLRWKSQTCLQCEVLCFVFFGSLLAFAGVKRALQFTCCVGRLVTIVVQLQRNAKNTCSWYQMKEHVVLFQPTTMVTWNQETGWWSLSFFVCNSGYVL